MTVEMVPLLFSAHPPLQSQALAHDVGKGLQPQLQLTFFRSNVSETGRGGEGGGLYELSVAWDGMVTRRRDGPMDPWTQKKSTN